MKIIVLWVEAFVQGFEPPCFHFFVPEKPGARGLSKNVAEDIVRLKI